MHLIEPAVIDPKRPVVSVRFPEGQSNRMDMQKDSV